MVDRLYSLEELIEMGAVKEDDVLWNVYIARGVRGNILKNFELTLKYIIENKIDPSLGFILDLASNRVRVRCFYKIEDRKLRLSRVQVYINDTVLAEYDTQKGLKKFVSYNSNGSVRDTGVNKTYYKRDRLRSFVW